MKKKKNKGKRRARGCFLFIFENVSAWHLKKCVYVKKKK